MEIVGQEEKRTLSVHKEHEFLLKLEAAGLNDDIAQKVISSKNNELAKKAVNFIQCGGVVGADSRFPFLKEFKLTIPTNYVPATRLDTFKAAHKDEFYDYNNDITDKNFAKVSHQLIPGKTYKVKFFGITQRVSSEDCLKVYRANRAYYTGAQGASVLYELKKEELIKGKWHCSFDEKDNLPFLGGYHWVPSVYAYSSGDFRFDLGNFEFDWFDSRVLVLLCDCDE